MLSPKILIQTRRKIKQRATFGSFLLVVLIFGLFFEAYMHNFNLVYIVLFFVFSFALFASPFALRNLVLLQTTLVKGQRIFAKEEGSLHFELYANKSFASYALNLKCHDQTVFLSELPPHQKTIVKLPFTPNKRGETDIKGCTLDTIFPIATIRFVLPVETSMSVMVYPMPKGESLESFLAKQTGRFGEESDFDGILPDAGRTHASRIHWPSVAKGNSAIKKFTHEIPLERLTFDFVRAGESDEERLSQLTLWILQCEAQKLDFAVQMPSQTLYSQRNSIDAILTTLATY